MSCDKFACELLGRERTLLRATAIAYEAELRSRSSIQTKVEGLS
jgi:DNA polymerase IV